MTTAVEMMTAFRRPFLTWDDFHTGGPSLKAGQRGHTTPQ